MEQFKGISNTFRIKRYYSIKTNNGRGYLASIADKIILRIIMFVSLFIYLYIKTKMIIVAMIIPITVTIIYSIFAHKINSKKLNENIKMINKELIIKKIYTNLMNKSTDSYIDYIKEIMLYYGIKDMIKTIRRDLDIIGLSGKEKIGIKCYQYSEDHKVDRNDIKNFFIEIRDKNINKGIIITTSSFSEQAQEFFKNIETIDIKFLVIEDIIDIIRETSLYPKNKDIEKMILKELDDNRLKVKNESMKIVSKSNTKSCIVAGIVIILFSKFAIFKLYYKIFGIILIGLGMVPIIKLSMNLILSGKTEDK